jgi:release factor glutamine methyltransferase
MTQSQGVWTVKDILQWMSARFAQLDIPTPLLDAQLLLGSVLKFSKVQIYMHLDRILTDSERAQLRELVKRRVAGEPVAYLLGVKEWHEISLQVDKRVLIPRPETETLLDFVLEVFRTSGSEPGAILDLCTGSGCLAIALAKKFPKARVIAVDLSEEALEVAKVNAASNGVASVEFLLADASKSAFYDYLANLPLQFDIIVANPPYVSEEEWMQCDVSVKNFEPRMALTSPDGGLALPRTIEHHVMQSQLLSSNSVFAMEVGLGHCARLYEEEQQSNDGEKEPFRLEKHNVPSWKLARGVNFALEDLTGRPRFRCHLRGLDFVSEKADAVRMPGRVFSSDPKAKPVDLAHAAQLEEQRRQWEEKLLDAHSEESTENPNHSLE